MTTPLLLQDLKRDEGCRLEAYQDTVGVWTVGFGHAGPDVKPGLTWTQAQADAQLQADIDHTVALLAAVFTWWQSLDSVRQDAVANMAFNLGVHGVQGFRNFCADMAAKNYDRASADMLLSKWATQVGDRAQRLAQMIKRGSRITS